MIDWMRCVVDRPTSGDSISVRAQHLDNGTVSAVIPHSLFSTLRMLADASTSGRLFLCVVSECANSYTVRPATERAQVVLTLLTCRTKWIC